MTTKEIGDFGENEVCKYLISNRMKILDRNFHSRYGEIDIIAKDGSCIVFVEVKTRKSSLYGMPSEYVTYSKRRKIIATAKYYLRNNIDVEMRFDIAEVYYSIKNNKPEISEINYIKNAYMCQ